MSLLKRKSRVFRVVCCLLAFLLVQSSLERVQAQPTPFLSPGQNYFVDLSVPYSLPVLRGMRVYPAKPFEFDFVVDSGDRHTLDQKETSLLIKYFLTCLTVPEEDLWVNLSPYESGRIIPDELALTDAGNNLLEQDKLLKQLASSLTYPESSLGKKFWEEVYKKAYEKFGTTNLPVSTYNKVWIVPDKAVVYDMGDSALIGDTHLKVMLEEDYLAFRKHRFSGGGSKAQQISASITKEIILPELEKEINEGKNFSPVRQIFHSMVLAAWFKRALKRNVLANFYVNKKKISGIDDVDKNAKEEIYRQYLRIYKVGAYNYIREDVDPISQQVVPRKYFSGGFFGGNPVEWLKTLQVPGGYEALKPYLAKFKGSFNALARVKLVPLGDLNILKQLMQGQHMMSDAAQMSWSKKFAVAVALSIPLLAASQGALAKTQAPVSQEASTVSKHVLHYGSRITTPADQEDLQKIKDFVQVEDVMALNRDTGSRVDIPYMRNNWDKFFTQVYMGPGRYVGWQLQAIFVTAQHKLGVNQDGRWGPVSRQALARTLPVAQRAIPVREVRPEAQVQEVEPAAQAQEVKPGATVPIVAPPTVIPTNEFYPISAKVPVIPVVGQVVARNSGIVTGLNPDKNEYQEGEVICTLEDPQMIGRIQGPTKELQIQESSLAKLRALFSSGAATEQEINMVLEQIQDLKKQLAQADAEQAITIVTAPHHIKAIDIGRLANGMSVLQGAQLFSYYDFDRIRVDLEVPISVNYFNHVELTLNADQSNGNPARNIFVSDWKPTPDPKTALVSLVVTPSSAILPGQNVQLSAKMYYPQNSERLDFIVGKQTTTVAVDKIEEYFLRSPAAGRVKFFVQEGSQVAAGDKLAFVDPKDYQVQSDEIGREIKDIDALANQAVSGAGGVQLMEHKEMDKLRSRKAQLLAQQEILQKQIDSMTIRAPYNGVIIWSAQHDSQAIQDQGNLLSISPETVFLGNINSGDNSRILFLNQDRINPGDTVRVQTPQGNSLLGEVIGVDQNAHSQSIELHGQVQSVVAKVFDPQHTLRPDLPVQVTLLTDSETQAIRTAGYLTHALLPQASSPPPPPPQRIVNRIVSLPNFVRQASAMSINLPPPRVIYYPAPEPSLNLDQVAVQVFTNKLVASPEFTRVLISKAREDLPGALQLSLIGGVWDSDGHLTFSGGIQGAFRGVTGALSTGSAIGVGLPIIAQLAGNIIDHLDGRVGKERTRNATQTKMDYYHLLTTRYQEVNRAQKLLIELGADQQKIAQWEDLVRDLGPAKSEMAARETAGGFSLTEDRIALEQKISDIEMQIESLKSDGQDRVVELNALTGQQITGLKELFFAKLPWEGSFPAIPKEQEEQMLAALTADGSLNPQMQEMVTSLSVMKQEAKLEGLDELPQITLTDLYSNKSPGGSIYNLLPGTDEATSKLVQGSNGILGLKIPLIDQKLGTLERITALKIKDVINNIMITKLELAQQLAKSVGGINALSVQIHQAEDAYRKAYAAWRLKAGHPGLYLPHQLVNERIQMDAWRSRIVTFKAQYLKAETDLWKLGQRSPANDRAQSSLPSITRKIALAGTLAVASFSVVPHAAVAQQGGKVPDSFHRMNPAVLWSLMQGNKTGSDTVPLAAIEKILIGDPNPLNRMDALKDFLDYYQNNQGSIESLENVVLNSPYQDVVGEVFRFMVDRKELPFFIQMIIKSPESKSKGYFINIAYQSLEDILTNYPDILKNLSPANFTQSTNSPYPDVSSGTAKKVFLSFLARDPVDSIAKARFLQSNYWSSQELARIYNELKAWTDNHSDDPQIGKINKLTESVYYSILRNEALGNIGTSFSLASYEHLSRWAPIDDFISSVRLRELAEQTDHYLRTSWRPQEWEGNLKSDLYARALKATRDLITNNPAPAGLSVSPVDDLTYQHIQNKNFDDRNPAGQKDYIAQMENISDLARTLESRTLLRQVVLNRLMATSDGRILVLKSYLESDDLQLLKLIQSRDWLKTIKEDAQNIKDPASNRIFREALEKMYDRKLQWPADARLHAFSPLELHSVIDTRGEVPVNAQIKMVATQWAVKVIEDITNSQIRPWSGYALRTPQEISLLGNITDQINNTLDPQEFDLYLDSLVKAQNPQTKGMLENLIHIRDIIASHLRANDQEVPRFLALDKYSLKAGLLVISIFSFFRIRGWYKKKRADVPELVDILKKELDLNGHSNGIVQFVFKLFRNLRNKPEAGTEDNAQISESQKIMAVSVDMLAFKPLQAWQKLLNDLPQETSVEELDSNFNTILNLAAEVLRLLPYSPDLISSSKKALNAEYIISYKNYNLLAIQTLEIFSKRFQEMDLTRTQQRWFMLDTDAMLDNMRYVARCLRILQYIGNINKVMSYKFADHDWSELYGWGPYVWARWALLYNLLWKRSQKRLIAELPELLEEGNALMPGLYENPDAIVKESIGIKGRLQDVTRNGRTFSDGSTTSGGHRHKRRSFWGRMLLFSGLAQILVTVAGAFLEIPYFILSPTILSFATFIALINFWLPNLEDLRPPWISTMNIIIEKLNDRLNESLKADRNDHRSRKQKIKDLAEQEGAMAIAKELDLANVPSVDAVVIITKEGQKVGDELRGFVERERGQLIRKDTPVEVMSFNQGSGDADLNALLKMKREFEERRKKDPNAKEWKDARVMFVFHGVGEDPEDGKIKWGIINGYRAAGSMPPSEGGNIIIYDAKPYYGPIKQVQASSITLFGSRVKRGDLKELGVINTSYSEDGNPTIHKVYEKLDIEKLLIEDKEDVEGKKMVTIFEDKNYDLHNASLEHFIAFNGIALLRPDAVDMLTQIAERLEEPDLKQRLSERLKQIHFTSDLLVPILFAVKSKDDALEAELDGYRPTRARWPDMKGSGDKDKIQIIKDTLKELYGIIAGAVNSNITVNAFVPHPWSESYNPSSNAAMSSSIRQKGGIDLNFQPQFIQRSSQANLSSIPDALPSMPEGFKGFNFNIIRFTSQLSVNGAFQLMFNSN